MSLFEYFWSTSKPTAIPETSSYESLEKETGPCPVSDPCKTCGCTCKSRVKNNDFVFEVEDPVVEEKEVELDPIVEEGLDPIVEEELDPIVEEELVEEDNNMMHIDGLTIKKFCPTMIDGTAIITAIGNRGSGKTFLMKHLQKELGLDRGTVISGNSGYPYKIGPNINVYENYDTEIIAEHINRSKMAISDYKKADVKDKTDPKSVIILEDDALPLTGTKLNNDKNLMWVFLNGRHARTYLLFCQQYSPISPIIIAHMDWIFLFREKNQNTRRKLYDQYAGFFPSFAVFEKVFDMVTMNYGCMVIKNCSVSHKLEDQVFWYFVPHLEL